MIKPGLGKLAANRNTERDDLIIQPESNEMQGTAEPTVGTSGTGIGSLAAVETLIKIVQINADRSKIVMHEIEKFLISKAIDFCMVQEPATDGKGVYLLDRHPFKVIAYGSQPKTAIIVVNQDIAVLSLKQLSTPHNAVAAITMGDFRLTVISSYFQFSEPTRTSVDALESILDNLSGGVLVCADVNARSALWHDNKPDARGETVVDFISRKELTIPNLTADRRAWT